MHKLRNLDQIRAKNALGIQGISGDKDGDIVKKMPTIIRDNGLLAAMAFAVSKDKNGNTAGTNKYRELFDRVAKHLHEVLNIRAQKLGSPNPAPGTELIREVTAMDAAQLRAVTSEALAYLAFVKRFHTKAD